MIRVPIFVILALGLLPPVGSGVQAATITSVWHDPTTNILNEDRVDLSWTYDGTAPDSLTLDFHDGTVVTLPGTDTSHRHIARMAGTFDLTLTAWTDGVSEVRKEFGFLNIAQREAPGVNVMFLHHSTGRYMLRDSGVRSTIDSYNDLNGTDIRFWDHDYHSGNTYTGIIKPDSTTYPLWSYGIEANNIEPSGYRAIFEGSAFRDSLFDRHDVFIFKNDHGTGDITSDELLTQYMLDYLTIRDVIAQFPNKLFIMLSGPPRRPTDITVEEADRARLFYDWVQSPGFMNGHPNIVFFDLFDLLANANDPADPERNMQREIYRLPPESNTDSHPNVLANMTIGPLFADFLFRILDPHPTTTDAPSENAPAIAILRGNAPNPFNPRTSVSWELRSQATVSLRVFDLSGRLVRTMLSPTRLDAGTHQATWDGTGDGGQPFPTGLYLLRLDAGTERHTHRLTLIR